jgi:indole-3-glycerol phosphate synthase
MLDKFRAAKAAEVEALRVLDEKGALPQPLDFARPSFSEALRGTSPVAVIAEYKRASPSKGLINADIGPLEVAQGYAAGGAAAISVLTEETYFQGSLDFLDVMAEGGPPLLRKDFLIDPLQARATAAAKASALLLIARMFETADALREMQDITSELGLEAVTEVFDERDLEISRQAGANIIQVNNRDLDTLTTDLGVSKRLIAERDDAELWISASGLSTGAHLKDAGSLGFDAVLIGTHLMEGGDPGGALQALLEEAVA